MTMLFHCNMCLIRVPQMESLRQIITISANAVYRRQECIL
jgi:hypothetical protein